MLPLYTVYADEMIFNILLKETTIRKFDMQQDSVSPFFQTLYRNFNERKIDLVLVEMTEDVKWANGMEGGYVYGQDEVRKYWTRQFGMVSSQVTPLSMHQEENQATLEVHQVVHDINGNLLADAIVTHIFQFHHGKIAKFSIGSD